MAEYSDILVYRIRPDQASLDGITQSVAIASARGMGMATGGGGTTGVPPSLLQTLRNAATGGNPGGIAGGGAFASAVSAFAKAVADFGKVSVATGQAVSRAARGLPTHGRAPDAHIAAFNKGEAAFQKLLSQKIKENERELRDHAKNSPKPAWFTALFGSGRYGYITPLGHAAGLRHGGMFTEALRRVGKTGAGGNAITGASLGAIAGGAQGGIGGALAGGGIGAIAGAAGGPVGIAIAAVVAVAAVMKKLFDVVLSGAESLKEFNGAIGGAFAQLEVATFKMKVSLGELFAPIIVPFVNIISKLMTSIGKIANLLEKTHVFDALGMMLDSIAAFLDVVNDLLEFDLESLNKHSGNLLTFGVDVGKARGGWIPGSGFGDTVPSMLTPGEFVVNARAARANAPLLESMNRMAGGGWVTEASNWQKEISNVMPNMSGSLLSHAKLMNSALLKFIHSGGRGVPFDALTTNWNKLQSEPGYTDAWKVAYAKIDPAEIVVNKNPPQVGGGPLVANPPPAPVNIPNKPIDISQTINMNMQMTLMHSHQVFEELMQVRNKIQEEMRRAQDSTRLLAGVIDAGFSPGF